MSITNSTEADVVTTDDPVLRMENIGHALMMASEAMREYAHQIMTNAQLVVTKLVPD